MNTKVLNPAAPAPEAPATGDVVVMMTEAEARDRVDQINKHSNRIGELLLELYEREGWKAMHYGSWRECVVAEFEQSQSRLYQLLDAAKVERNISNILENGETLPAKAVEQLKHLEPEQQREVVQKAKEAAPDSKITAKQIEQAVDADSTVEPTPQKSEPANGSEPVRLQRCVTFAWGSVQEAFNDLEEAYEIMTDVATGSRANFKEFSSKIKSVIRELKSAAHDLEIAAKATGWKDFDFIDFN
jgi:hypothetical protein